MGSNDDIYSNYPFIALSVKRQARHHVQNQLSFPFRSHVVHTALVSLVVIEGRSWTTEFGLLR